MSFTFGNIKGDTPMIDLYSRGSLAQEERKWK